MISVHLRTKSGENNSRQFNTNDGISIYGSVSGWFLPDLLAYVRLEVTDQNGETIFYDETNANLLGDYNFYFVAPAYSTKLNINVFVKHPGGNVETNTIPIGIGNETAGTLPSPQSSFNWLDMIPLALAAIIGFFIYNEVKK